MRPQPGGLSFLLPLLHLSPPPVFASQQQQSGETLTTPPPPCDPSAAASAGSLTFLGRSSSLLCLSTGARERCGNQSIYLGATTRGTLGVGGGASYHLDLQHGPANSTLSRFFFRLTGAESNNSVLIPNASIGRLVSPSASNISGLCMRQCYQGDIFSYSSTYRRRKTQFPPADIENVPR